MARPRDNEPFVVSGFPAGMNNTVTEERLPRDDNGAPIVARELVNGDFDASGQPRLREGYALALDGATHSAWSDDYVPFGLMVSEGTLYAVHPDVSVDTILEGVGAHPVSYSRLNDGVLWTNSVQSGLITLGMESLPWCPAHPHGQPTLALVAGALDPGDWQVAVTFIDPLGRESGAKKAAAVAVTAGCAIALSNIPQPPVGYRIRIYASLGGAVPRAVATLAAGEHTYTIIAPPQGRNCETLLLEPMPPGQLVANGNGRQFVARGKEVLFSPALRYGLFNPREGRVGFVGRVDFMAFVGDGTDGAGLYVSDGKRTYFLAGANPMDWRQVIAYPSGAVPGQIAFVPGDVWGLGTKTPLPVWQARNGRLCVGLPGGEVYTPQPRDGGPEVVFDDGDSAAILHRATSGDHRIVSAVKGARPQALAIRDRLTVTEYRHDT